MLPIFLKSVEEFTYFSSIILMLREAYFSQNYASIIRQGLVIVTSIVLRISVVVVGVRSPPSLGNNNVRDMDGSTVVEEGSKTLNEVY